MEIKKKNILLIGDFTYGTGNLITAQRIKKIFNELGYNVFIYSIQYLLSGENESNIFLKKFLLKNQISLIVGINVWRSGKIIYDLLYGENDIDNQKDKGKDSINRCNYLIILLLYQFYLLDIHMPNIAKVIPYVFIVSGTDANVFLKVNK